LKASTSGQFWYFVPISGESGYYYICNYYWTVHSNDEPACFFDDMGYLVAWTKFSDPMYLQPS
jgi:hypothetical protein